MNYEIIKPDQAEEMFRSLLDDMYPMVNACDHEYYPSQAIQLLDPIVYRAGMLDYYDRIYRDLQIAVEDYTDELLFDCPQCGLIVEDLRGDWCKDCDKQAQAGEAND
jgi:hypothetical protein